MLPDRPSAEAQTAQAKLAESMLRYCDVSSLLPAPIFCEYSTQPPVKPFSPSLRHCCINLFIPMGRKNAISCFTNSFCVSVLLCLSSALRFFTPVSATQPFFERPQPFAEPTPALSSTTASALRVCDLPCTSHCAAGPLRILRASASLRTVYALNGSFSIFCRLRHSPL